MEGGVLAVKSYDLTRDEVVRLIEEKCSAVGKDPHSVILAYRNGELDDWSEYADILALAELLEDDDALIAS